MNPKLIPLLTCLTLGTAVTATAKQDIVDTAIGAGSFKTLVTAVKAAGLVDTLKSDGPFTVFAPTDEAFAKLPKGTVESLLKPQNKQQLVDILTYHVVSGKVKAKKAAKLDSAKTVNGQPLDLSLSGETLKVNQAKVVKADIKSTNGIIHVIDQVLLPAVKKTASSGQQSSNGDIVDTAVQAGSFKTLVAAVKAAGLVETLKGDGPFTVFAPTDEAFAKLPKGTIETLLKPENKQKLIDILTYHVVAGSVNAEKASKLKSAGTVNGAGLHISHSCNSLKINNAKVVKADIMASNGIIHVIDQVLLPEAKKTASNGNNTHQILRNAIHKGVPMFNSGHHKMTASLYMKAGMEVMQQCSSASCPDARKAISAALHKASAEHSATTQAWIMRKAFDHVLTAN